jgi:hypothetical protein
LFANAIAPRSESMSAVHISNKKRGSSIADRFLKRERSNETLSNNDKVRNRSVSKSSNLVCLNEAPGRNMITGTFQNHGRNSVEVNRTISSYNAYPEGTIEKSNLKIHRETSQEKIMIHK